METFFVNNKKIIFAVAGAAAGATFLIWLHQRTKETNKDHHVSQEQISAVPTEEKSKEDQGEYLSYSGNYPDYQVKIPLRPGQDMSLPQELKEKFAKDVEVAYEDGYLRFFGMSTLWTAVKRFSFPKFYLLLKQYRQKRRIVQGYDEERYIAAQAEFVQGLRDILRQITLEVLAQVNISEEDYEKSSKHHNNFALDDFVGFMRTEWFDTFDSFDGKKLNADERAEIIKAQTQLYKNEKENIQKLKERHPNLSNTDAVELIQNKIDDQIYQKYNVELEDFVKFSFLDTNDSEQDARKENSSAKDFFISTD